MGTISLPLAHRQKHSTLVCSLAQQDPVPLAMGLSFKVHFCKIEPEAFSVLTVKFYITYLELHHSLYQNTVAQTWDQDTPLGSHGYQDKGLRGREALFFNCLPQGPWLKGSLSQTLRRSR